MSNTTRKRGYADFDDRVFERGAKERAQVPLEYAGLQQRRRCPKGTRWHKETKSCQSVVNVLGDPIGALTESILVKPKKTVSFKKSTSSSKMNSIPTSLSSSQPKSVSSSQPKSVPKSKTKSLSSTRKMSKRKLNFSSSSKKKSSLTSSAKLRKSKFMGLDDFYSSDVDLGKKIGLNDFLDSSSIKLLFNPRPNPKTKPKTKPKKTRTISNRSKSKSMSLNTAERADRQAFLDEENYSPTYNTAELADREAFLREEEEGNNKPKTKTSVKQRAADNDVRFFGTQRVVSSKK